MIAIMVLMLCIVDFDNLKEQVKKDLIYEIGDIIMGLYDDDINISTEDIDNVINKYKELLINELKNNNIQFEIKNNQLIIYNCDEELTDLVEDVYYITVLAYALEFSYEKYGVLREV